MDASEFIIRNFNGEDLCRLAGSMNGQQLVIQNCSNCMIFILDYVDSINIDDCANCKIVLGPVKGRFVQFITTLARFDLCNLFFCHLITLTILFVLPVCLSAIVWTVSLLFLVGSFD